MITLLIAAFLIGALILTFVSGRAAATDAEQLARMQENARIISEYLVRDVRNAGYIDEVEALVGQDDLMRLRFADIGVDGTFPDDVATGNTLRIRYAGRGHCGEQFNTFVLVENEYSLRSDEQGNTILQCRGRHVPGGTVIGEGVGWEDVLRNPRAVDLISGIEAISFTRLDDGCEFNYQFDPNNANQLANSCLGVRIDIGLEGVRGDTRQLSLLAAFRNVIIERTNRGIPAPSGG